MSVASFLAELRSRDIHVWPQGDQLRCNAPAGVLTPDLRDQLRQRKRDIVEFLQSANAVARQQRAIVPLQLRGSRTPVFAVPGHNGDVFCYRALAQSLGDDQPFFGLQPPGVDGDRNPLASVEDLAEYFTAQILAFRPDGPYVIGGYCAGGTIAFELARQLQQNGAAVSFVALFAGAYPTWYGILPQLRQRLVQRVKSVSKHARALLSLSYGNRRQYISEILRRRKAQRNDRAPDSVLTLRARVKNATARGVRRYTPKYFAGRVSLFLPNQKCMRQGNPLMRWQPFAQNTDVYWGPDGCEGDIMLLEPYAGVIAELFQRCSEKNNATLRASRA
jgi:thioesterase domain-containing protein